MKAKKVKNLIGKTHLKLSKKGKKKISDNKTDNLTTTYIKENYLSSFTEFTPINMQETSGATYTTSDIYKTTIHDLEKGDWKFDEKELDKLANGEVLVKIRYNRVGTPIKRLFQRSDADDLLVKDF